MKPLNRKKVGSKVNNLPQCLVASETVFVRKCSQALSRVTGIHQILNKKLERGDSTSIYFFNAPPIEAEIKGENRPVLPLSDPSRWLHVAIDLNHVDGKVWRVNHISICLLKGEPSNKLKAPLLRAEWQFYAEEDQSGHAQPHWHVLGAAGINEAALPSFDEIVEASSGFKEYLKDSQPTVEHGDPFNHFHYAMVTDWHCTPSKGPSNNLNDETAVICWLEGCISYINHQLAYVDRKSGISSSLPFN